MGGRELEERKRKETQVDQGWNHNTTGRDLSFVLIRTLFCSLECSSLHHKVYIGVCTGQAIHYAQAGICMYRLLCTYCFIDTQSYIQLHTARTNCNL